MPIRNQGEAEVDNDLLPDRLINPEDYEPPFHTPYATAKPAGANEAQRRLITPVYTYSSINWFCNHFCFKFTYHEFSVLGQT